MRTLVAFILAATVVGADDWPQFRGPQGSGVSGEKEFPLQWSPEKNIRWRSALPGNGSSSPVVSKGRVFVTAAEDQGKKRSLVCLDRADGKVLWTRTITLPYVEPTQEANPYCGSSPCADGERVTVWHSSAGMFCYDFDGKPLWHRDLGKFDHQWGYGASPVLHGGRVLMNCGPGDRSFLVALDQKTGQTIWQHDETGGHSKEWIGSWATPRIVGRRRRKRHRRGDWRGRARRVDGVQARRPGGRDGDPPALASEAAAGGRHGPDSGREALDGGRSGLRPLHRGRERKGDSDGALPERIGVELDDPGGGKDLLYGALGRYGGDQAGPGVARGPGEIFLRTAAAIWCVSERK